MKEKINIYLSYLWHPQIQRQHLSWGVVPLLVRLEDLDI
jgi:hypothetical protein